MSRLEDLAGTVFAEAAGQGAERTVVQSTRVRTEDVVAQDAGAARVERSERGEFAVRVYRGGTVGVATGQVPDRGAALDLVRRAVVLAEAGNGRVDGRAGIGGSGGSGGSGNATPGNGRRRGYRTPLHVDPFTVPLAERGDLVREAVAAATGVAGCGRALARACAYRRTSTVLTSEGDRDDLELTQTGGVVRAFADGPSGVGERSFPERSGRHDSGGWEHVLSLGLPEGAREAAREAVLLASAPPCPAGTGPAVIDSGQLALQIHESIGHPLELDRILGWELDYAGGSFVRVEDVGRLRYASEHVSVTAAPVSGRGVGSLPWDDDGTPTESVPLVDRGLLVGLLGSAATTRAAGLPPGPGSARTETAGLPLVRMTNVDLAPGSGTTDDLLSGMGEGILLCGNRSFSIDADRDRFHFTCEMAWRVRGGRLVEPLRAPAYHGRTLDFWRSCRGVAGPQEWAMHSVTFCMKGNPVQTARVGHGAAPALFDRVTYGAVGSGAAGAGASSGTP